MEKYGMKNAEEAGLKTYEPERRADLNPRRPLPFYQSISIILLLKLYRLVSWFEDRLEGEVKKPRFGAP